MRGRGERKLARVQVRRGGRPATCCDFVRIAVPQMIGRGRAPSLCPAAVRRRTRQTLCGWLELDPPGARALDRFVSVGFVVALVLSIELI